MKRAFALLLALILLLLSGCQKKGKPTAIALTPDYQEIELPVITIVADEYCWYKENLQTFVESVPGYNTEFTAEIIKLEGEPERSTYLERMRVELMAGKGPDLFLCDCVYGNIFGGAADEGKGPMFNFPQQLMEHRIFLPLDEYLENAQYMEPEEIIPELLELGRGSEGQMIIPLQYDLIVTAVPEDKYTEPAERSRKGLMESGNPYLEHVGRGYSLGLNFLDPFGAPADYENEELTFTAEELLEAALDLWEGENLWYEGYYDDTIPGAYTAWLSETINGRESETEGRLLVPAYNRDGGVTACVTNYAAINRNANYPEYAFRVLDLLAGKKEMQSTFLYNSLNAGMAVYSGFGDTEPFKTFTLTENMQRQYLELKGNITAAKFVTALEREAVYGIVSVCRQEGSTQEDVEKAVKNSYRAMRMMLAES